MIDSPIERWILDASVAINLLAMSDPTPILEVLSVPRVIPEQATREVVRLDHPARRGRNPIEEVRQIATIVTLTPPEWEVFGELVGAPSPDGLDDGEAAVMAVAIVRGGACLIDERKCRRIARERQPPVSTRTTVDLLRWSTSQGIASAVVSECLYDALRYARMRIPPGDVAWVGEQLGAERLSEFPALKNRQPR